MKNPNLTHVTERNLLFPCDQKLRHFLRHRVKQVEDHLLKHVKKKKSNQLSSIIKTRSLFPIFHIVCNFVYTAEDEGTMWFNRQSLSFQTIKDLNLSMTFCVDRLYKLKIVLSQSFSLLHMYLVNNS